MDKAPAVLVANQRVPRSRPVPRLRLLIELEPRHRVFFGNLADLLLSRRVPQIPITSRPAPFWSDVFVPSGAPWSSFLESMLWHSLLLILVVWAQSRVWEPVKLFPQRDTFHRSIAYYPPTPTFRAADSRAPRTRERPRAKRESAPQPARQPAMPVTPEQKPKLVTPPDIRQATARPPNLPSSHPVTPAMPFSATTGPQRNALAGPSAVVAPPPQVNQNVDQATARRLALPQASAVAPTPELGPSAARAAQAPNTGGLRVVPPPPAVQPAGASARTGRLSSVTGTNVVPPPPPVQSAGIPARDTRLGSLAGAGSAVVPPPPSVQNAGSSSRAGRISSLTGAGTNIVPPPPSVQGTGNSSRGGRVSSLSGAGTNVVPPPPSLQSAGNGAGDARLGSIAGAGSQVVPPPPSLQGSGVAAGGTRLGSLAGAGADAVSPPLPVQSAGNSGAGGPGKILEPMDPLPLDAASSAPAVNNGNEVTIEELPLGLLGVVFAAPGSSFYSNFEVFVAKRRVGKDQLQLIKLVYEFLPYQRRLSDYNLNNQRQRVIKLRVTPDPGCDESLGQVIQSHTDPSVPATESQKLPAALLSYDMNAILPCYRTTATDFQRAMSESR